MTSTCRSETYNGLYVLRRSRDFADGRPAYVARVEGERRYTHSLMLARVYQSRGAAENERLVGDEYLVPVNHNLQLEMELHR